MSGSSFIDSDLKYNAFIKNTSLKFIREICSILGLKSSIDTTIELGHVQLYAFQKWYCEMNNESRLLLHDCFKIKKKINLHESLRDKELQTSNIKSLLNAVFQTWSGMMIKNIHQKQNSVSPKGRKFVFLSSVSCLNIE